MILLASRFVVSNLHSKKNIFFRLLESGKEVEEEEEQKNGHGPQSNGEKGC